MPRPDEAARAFDAPRADALTGAVLALDGVGKTFGVVAALKQATFGLRPGEVLSLLGENGAGKSTCVKILAGLYAPSVGSVLLDGRPVAFGSPQDAQRAGIAVVHQHPGLFPDLTIAENIFMGDMPAASGLIDANAMQSRSRALLQSIGLMAEPGALLGTLRPSEQQLVEIARALSRDAKVLIMDEPTASLSLREVDRLFEVVDRLKARGVALMFVSHRMDEIYRISDRIAVLRDGALIGVEEVADLPRDKAIRMMVGRELTGMYPHSGVVPGDVVLETKGLSRSGEYDGIDLTVRAGEILGIGGLVGAGRTELARSLFGITRPDAGEIRMSGKHVAFSNANDAMAHGIAYVSEDRLGQSLVMDFPILTNAGLTVLDQTATRGFTDRAKTLSLVSPHLDRLSLRFRSYDQPVNTLSGGNQQKVVLSKWLATNPKLLILDEPTQGIDVQSKAEVHAMIADLAAQGLAIILISSELPELLGMSDRVIVLREGRKTGEFDRSEATQENVMRAAADSGVEASAGENADRIRLVPNGAAASALAEQDAALKQERRASWFRREYGLAAAMLVVIIPVALINPLIFSPVNLRSLAMDASLLMMAALAQMLVMVTRNIDLSVASVIGMAAYGSALFMSGDPATGVLGGIALACVIGLACGLANGAAVAIGRVPSIVVTLGTMSVFRGLHSLWTGGKQISADMVPQAWLDLTSARLFGVPLMVFIAAAILAIAALILNRTEPGRRLFAIGSNPGGAELIGLPSVKLTLAAFSIAGVLAGLAGALWASRYATIDARVAYGYELSVIAAAVVGGVALRGGAGTILGIILGALTLLVIRNGLILVRVDPLWLQGVYGLVILAAIGVDAAMRRRAAKLGSSTNLAGGA